MRPLRIGTAPQCVLQDLSSWKTSITKSLNTYFHLANLAWLLSLVAPILSSILHIPS
jgi:hypothetical protein